MPSYLNAYHYLTVAPDADLDEDELTYCCSVPAAGAPLRCVGCRERVGAN
jgi:hypothetical protein